MSPWLILAGVAALGAAYVGGRMDGAAIEQAGQLQAERAAAKVRAELQAKVDAAAEAAQARELDRQGQVREIRHETERIVERPVYRNLCVDAAGVQLLERAAAIANDDGGAASAGAAAAAAGADRGDGGRADGRPVPLLPDGAL